MDLEIIKGNIVDMNVETIVNAANTKLKKGGGVCGAIFKAAGKQELSKACNDIGKCEIGKAVITNGFKLKADYIIHTVGPIYDSKNEHKLNEQLYSCYCSSLELAEKNGIKTIAFPLVSSGIYGYKPELAMSIAKKAVYEYKSKTIEKVYLVLFERKRFSIGGLFTKRL